MITEKDILKAEGEPSDILRCFDVFRPIEEAAKELIEDNIKSNNHYALWSLNEIAKGRKP